MGSVRNNYAAQNSSADSGLPVNVKNWIKWGVIAVAALILYAILDPFYSVPTGSRGVVTQFGRIVRIAPEGLSVLPPWQKLTTFSIRAEAANIDNAPGATSDTQPVWTSLTVRYAIEPDQVSKVYEQYSHDGNLSSYVDTAAQEVFKAVTAKFEAAQLIDQRQQVSADIYDLLQKKLAVYGAHVITVDMRDFRFQQSYMDAINQKVDQQQLLLAAENKLKTVQVEQQQKVAAATAESESMKQVADGEAYATLTKAKAQAQALQIQNEALAKSENVLRLREIEVEMTKAQRWNGQLPQNIYAGAPIPFLNTSPDKGQ